MSRGIRRFTADEITDIYWLTKVEKLSAEQVAEHLVSSVETITAVLDRIQEIWQPDKAFNPDYPLSPAYREAMKKIRVKLMTKGRSNVEQRTDVETKAPEESANPPEPSHSNDLYADLDHAIDDVKLLIAKIIDREAKKIAQDKVHKLVRNLTALA